jgi:hypothetical protein
LRSFEKRLNDGLTGTLDNLPPTGFHGPPLPAGRENDGGVSADFQSVARKCQAQATHRSRNA